MVKYWLNIWCLEVILSQINEAFWISYSFLYDDNISVIISNLSHGFQEIYVLQIKLFQYKFHKMRINQLFWRNYLKTNMLLFITMNCIWSNIFRYRNHSSSNDKWSIESSTRSIFFLTCTKTLYYFFKRSRKSKRPRSSHVRYDAQFPEFFVSFEIYLLAVVFMLSIVTKQLQWFFTTSENDRIKAIFFW